MLRVITDSLPTVYASSNRIEGRYSFRVRLPSTFTSAAPRTIPKDVRRHTIRAECVSVTQRSAEKLLARTKGHAAQWKYKDEALGAHEVKTKSYCINPSFLQYPPGVDQRGSLRRKHCGGI